MFSAELLVTEAFTCTAGVVNDGFELTTVALYIDKQLYNDILNLLNTLRLATTCMAVRAVGVFAFSKECDGFTLSFPALEKIRRLQTISDIIMSIPFLVCGQTFRFYTSALHFLNVKTMSCQSATSGSLDRKWLLNR